MTRKDDPATHQRSDIPSSPPRAAAEGDSAEAAYGSDDAGGGCVMMTVARTRWEEVDASYPPHEVARLEDEWETRKQELNVTPTARGGSAERQGFAALPPPSPSPSSFFASIDDDPGCSEATNAAYHAFYAAYVEGRRERAAHIASLRAHKEDV